MAENIFFFIMEYRQLCKPILNIFRLLHRIHIVPITLNRFTQTTNGVIFHRIKHKKNLVFWFRGIDNIGQNFDQIIEYFRQILANILN